MAEHFIKTWQHRQVLPMSHQPPLVMPSTLQATTDTFDAVRTLLIDGHDGRKIPLGQLADVTQTFGPAAIRREAGIRRIAIEASVSGRDLGSTALEVREIVAAQLKLPAGYFFRSSGAKRPERHRAARRPIAPNPRHPEQV